tara:strand:- start:7038 stop:7955 length:918 start_codon:yes stop_codon:yes gene_type:complete
MSIRIHILNRIFEEHLLPVHLTPLSTDELFYVLFRLSDVTNPIDENTGHIDFNLQKEQYSARQIFEWVEVIHKISAEIDFSSTDNEGLVRFGTLLNGLMYRIKSEIDKKININNIPKKDFRFLTRKEIRVLKKAQQEKRQRNQINKRNQINQRNQIKKTVESTDFPMEMIKTQEQISKKWTDKKVETFQSDVDKIVNPYENESKKQDLDMEIKKIIIFLESINAIEKYPILNNPILNSNNFFYLEIQVLLFKAFQSRENKEKMLFYLRFAINNAEIGIFLELITLQNYKDNINFINAFKESMTTN